MKCLVVLIKGGCKAVDARSFLEEHESSVLDCKDTTEVMNHLNNLAGESVCSVWEMTEFMEAWNDSDDDCETIEMKKYFMGYVYIK